MTNTSKIRKQRIEELKRQLARANNPQPPEPPQPPTPQPPEPPQPPTPQQNLEDYIHVPEINIHIAKQRTHKGLNWYDTHKELHKENLKMPTIPEFISFLKYLKGDYQNLSPNHKKEAEQILDEILTVRNPWRANWLDADFKYLDQNNQPLEEDNPNGTLYINYNHEIGQDNNFKPGNSEPLEQCLMQDKTPGINLDSWLNNHTNQGLPLANTTNGDLYYWYPRKDNISVARFNAYSDRAVLYCNGGPAGSDASLGVFASISA